MYNMLPGCELNSSGCMNITSCRWGSRSGTNLNDTGTNWGLFDNFSLQPSGSKVTETPKLHIWTDGKLEPGEPVGHTHQALVFEQALTSPFPTLEAVA